MALWRILGKSRTGVALAAKVFGTQATIIMPHDAPANKVANTKAYGATVVHYERGVESREAIGERLAQTHGLHLINPTTMQTLLQDRAPWA